MMTSSNGNIFRVTGHWCGEFTGSRWIPLHKGQWRGAFMFSLICVWINVWINNREAGDLRHYLAHYDVTVMMMIGMFCHFYQLHLQLVIRLTSFVTYPEKNKPTKQKTTTLIYGEGWTRTEKQVLYQLHTNILNTNLDISSHCWS